MTESLASAQPVTRRPRNIILIAVGLGLLAIVGAIVFNWMFVDNELLNNPNACPPDDRAWVERIAGFDFPPSADNLYARCINWQEWRGQLAFDMNPAELDIFLANIEMETPLVSSDKPKMLGLFADDATAKQIEAVTTYLYGENRIDDVWHYILIDTANPSLYRVHILFGRD
jgi:hypothetical protein